ncbi:MAG: ABC transporter ATP-binding protein [Patescibacteria group bacterium]|nr:ABC transporter ATP-binding protein [Patescibacteria group bacterium]
MNTIDEFKIILEYLKPYKKQVKKLAVLAVITSLFTAIIPYIYGRLVDAVSMSTFSVNFVLALLGIWLLMDIISAFCNKIIEQKGSVIRVDIANDLVCKISQHIIKLNLEFHSEKSIGSIFSKLERSASHIRMITGEIVFWVFPKFLTIFIGIIILFSIEPLLAIGVFLLFFGYIVITIYKVNFLIEAQKKLSKTHEIASGNLYDAFLNINTIKSCSAENFQNKKIKKDYRENLGFAYKNYFSLWASIMFLQNIFLSCGFFALFCFALILLKNNSITAGTLIMFLGYFNILSAPLNNLAWQWERFKTGITVIKRTRELLDIEPENYNEKGKIIKNIKPKIEFQDISFGYEKNKMILKDISFNVPAYKRIALVGGSGEGKTTLVDLISLYSAPSKGKILIDDIDIKELNLSFLRKIIAYVPQEIILFNDTVKNNIKYGKPNATNQEIIFAAKTANANEFIEGFPNKYDQLVGERGIKLSTGQKQRIAIARALIQDAKILILDEATSALDTKSEKLVQNALEKLIKHRTTFIIAHRLSTIKTADKILVLEKGKIAEQGTHKQLLARKGAYHKFYSIQFQK